MLKIKRINKKFLPNCSRVIIKPHIPKEHSRVENIITRVLNLSEAEVEQALKKVMTKFSHRHKNIFNIFNNHYNEIKNFIPQNIQINKNKCMLLGAYFSCEYSIQSAAFFNPSIIAHPNQNNLDKDSLRFILSFRSVGEGHISSIEFRSGIIDKNCEFIFDKTSPYAQKGTVIKQNECLDYEIQFCLEQELSERIIFPSSQYDCKGLEDARFVCFSEGKDITYYATYTAYNGYDILPKLIETKDFLNFKILSLSGKYSKNKGMALFPRKINDKYMMISRVDGENLYLMSSDNLLCWDSAKLLKIPQNTWEFVQIGNCGSPIETKYGWILLTHGVGPMREYSLGVILLDLENPNKIIGNMSEPLLTCTGEEREGYVPNVIYSCGALIHNENLIIPYAMSDTCSGIATVSLFELLNNINEERGLTYHAKST